MTHDIKQFQDYYAKCEAYHKGYIDGREELVQSVCDSLREEFYDYDSENDYYAGFDDGLKRAMRLMKAEVREQDGRE
jgi:hypothetical protein